MGRCSLTKRIFFFKAGEIAHFAGTAWITVCIHIRTIYQNFCSNRILRFSIDEGLNDLSEKKNGDNFWAFSFLVLK